MKLVLTHTRFWFTQPQPGTVGNHLHDTDIG